MFENTFEIYIKDIYINESKYKTPKLFSNIKNQFI